MTDSGNLLFLNVSNLPQTKTVQWLEDIRFQADATAAYTEEIHPETSWHAGKLFDSLESVKEVYRANEYDLISSLGCYDDGDILIPSTEEQCFSIAVYDISDSTEWSADMSMVKTFFIMIVLGVGAVSFSRVAEVLVIGPIERMVS